MRRSSNGGWRRRGDGCGIALPRRWSGSPRRRAPATGPGGLARDGGGCALGVVVGGRPTRGWFLFPCPFGGHAGEGARGSKRSVVPPFTNLGPAGPEYFADGVTEEITARLAAVGDLRVIGSTSATAYKGTKKTILDIGRELGVAYILEGSEIGRAHV